MKTKMFFLSTLIFFAGCLPKHDDGGYGWACTQMAYVTNLAIDVKAGETLPANLSYAVNGDEVDFDECSETGEWDYSLKQSDGRSLKIMIYNHEELKKYFSDKFVPLQDTKVSLVLYGRESCEDEPVEILRSVNLQVIWEEQYPNGRDCGGAGYQGTATVPMSDE